MKREKSLLVQLRATCPSAFFFKSFSLFLLVEMWNSINVCHNMMQHRKKTHND